MYRLVLYLVVFVALCGLRVGEIGAQEYTGSASGVATITDEKCSTDGDGSFSWMGTGQSGFIGHQITTSGTGTVSHNKSFPNGFAKSTRGSWTDTQTSTNTSVNGTWGGKTTSALTNNCKLIFSETWANCPNVSGIDISFNGVADFRASGQINDTGRMTVQVHFCDWDSHLPSGEVDTSNPGCNCHRSTWNYIWNQ